MLTVHEGDTAIELSVADVMKYHGPGYPGGVAHAYLALQQALVSLGPVQRREVVVRTAFPGPGGRDALEMALRAVTDERYTVDSGLARPDRGVTLARYVWQFGYRGHEVTVQLRDGGFVTSEFIELGATSGRTAEQEARLVVLKQEMTDRLLAAGPGEAYETVEVQAAAS
ncbi:hypothetical protein AAFP35_03835 [Gordonia sp. CPCC 206044]|uniref:hypothetical protein n=1 Tax=Gordonia sp. CPCC 206044 TaxID=3140793 RepID=UPI003AF39089